MQADLLYYRRRLAEETAAAAAAADPKVSAVHVEFAQRYSDRISQLQAEAWSAPLHLVSAA